MATGNAAESLSSVDTPRIEMPPHGQADRTNPGAVRFSPPIGELES
ncbi:hypothetical protein MKK75_29250 [Methylobacterium sp. J-030]|nr:hypothetical protein [Methylobacterium sp. J-030]MCJ2072833.1 hypothetical protein [Methylobacterium sp. J-030]